MKIRQFALAMVVSCLFASLGAAADWPQWRGPQRSGVSQETGLLQHWPESGPELVWRVDDLGDGYGTLAVVGDRFYVVGNRGMESEFVQARSVSDGQQIWSAPLGKVGAPDQRPSYPMARSTPTVHGGVLTHWAPTETWSRYKLRPAKRSGARACGTISAAGPARGLIQSHR